MVGEIQKTVPLDSDIKCGTPAERRQGGAFALVDDNLQEKYMKAAGFVDVQVKDIPCPYGTWPKDPRQKEVGLFTKAGFKNNMDGKFS